MSDVFFPFPLKRNNSWTSFVSYNNCFTKEECAKIIALMKAPVEATVGPKEHKMLVPEIRTSQVEWLSLNDETEWIYKRLQAFISVANDSHYKFNIAGFSEKLQLTKYNRGGHYGWHQDSAQGALSVRKLSAVVQLTDPNSYTGGELEFFGEEHATPTKEQGHIIVFPPYMYHRVKQVTGGSRYSLVVWVSGDALV